MTCVGYMAFLESSRARADSFAETSARAFSLLLNSGGRSRMYFCDNKLPQPEARESLVAWKRRMDLLGWRR